MPSWAIHLAVTTKLSKKLGFSEENKNLFLMGNLLPDILNGYVIKNISHVVPHKEAHFEKEVTICNHKEFRYDLEGFYEKYSKQFNNMLMFGYYTHLLTDFYWNDLVYGKTGIFDKEKNMIGLRLNNGKELIGNKELIREIKHNDFDLYSKYIYENQMAECPVFCKKLLQDAKQLDWLELQEQDILEMIEYIKGRIELKNPITVDKPYYQLYSKEFMDKNMEQCVQFVYEKVKAVIN